MCEHPDQIRIIQDRHTGKILRPNQGQAVIIITIHREDRPGRAGIINREADLPITILHLQGQGVIIPAVLLIVHLQEVPGVREEAAQETVAVVGKPDLN